MLTVGCAVPQKRGMGQALRRKEATTDRPYWLYLPKGYSSGENPWTNSKRYPVVVTFHGMRPFDDYQAHIKQWQQEADRYGFIVIAPRLKACDVSQPFPINRITPAVKADEQATLAILDEVFRTTHADPNHVLSTSFSSGGYLAHYMVNRHPERFSCIAVFQSNFAAELLDPAQVPLYRDYPVAILSSENDLGVTQRESAAALDWYDRNGFKVLAKQLLTRGHERTPEVAAIIFADSAHIKPNSPPRLNQYRVADVQPTSQHSRPSMGSRSPRSANARANSTPKRGTGDSGDLLFGDRVADAGARGPNRSTDRADTAPVSGRSTSNTPPPTRAGTAQPGNSSNTPQIRVNSKIGLAPHLISFEAVIPYALRHGADCLWMHNNAPICRGFSGQKIFTTPGEHRLSVLIVTDDNRELRASTQITVLEPR